DILFAHSCIKADSLSQLESALASMIGEDETNYECNVHLLLNEYEVDINGVRKYLSLDWDPIIEDHTVVKMMVSVRDVTVLRQMEQEAREQKRELAIIGQLIKVPADKFRVLAASCRSYIAQSYAQLDGAQVQDSAVIALVFRYLHTIKGNSRTYHLSYLSEAAHQAESYCGQLTHQANLPWDEQKLRADLQHIAAILAEYEQVFIQVLGRSLDEPDTQPGIWLDGPTATRLGNFLFAQQAELNKFDATLLQPFAQTMHPTLPEVLADILQSLPSLALQLNKPAPQVQINSAGLRFTPAGQALLHNVFTHLLRNSLDHGIEAPERRQSSGKAAAGTIYIQAHAIDQKLIITLGDDGQGLDIHRLFQLGVERGIWSADEMPSADAIAQIIFRSGISSKEQVTDISGRGVGMDAVKEFLNEQGASIHLRLDGDTATPSLERANIPCEFIISLPPALFIQQPAEHGLPAQ
ncbi:MAG TPA: Hpt domain-containing protein, partial [Cellvibrionaceae bacterium]|nr:Hpt domain-containing protein [Cellvibrionaceae bacterium]